jgi:TolB-like protein/DNA-binding winged helix-turn-helix (wHTH) protein
LEYTPPYPEGERDRSARVKSTGASAGQEFLAMEAAPGPNRHVRFSGFELDLRTHELHSNGRRLKLRGHPVRVLEMLLESPGELVTREEIRHRLWRDDTFVDFEHILNNTMNRLREELGDCAEKPVFIETLPRQGYRFICPVQEDDETNERIEKDPDGGKIGTAVSQLPGALDQSSAQNRDYRAIMQAIHVDGRDSHRSPLAPEEADRDSSDGAHGGYWRPARRTSVLVLFGLAALAAILFLLNVWRIRDRVFVWLSPSPQFPPAIRSIAVLPLENLSGDPEQEYFADGLTDSLITNLGQIETMRVISRASVMRYKRTKMPLAQISRELDADAVVAGTVQRSASQVRISVQLLDARMDRHLWAQTYERDLADVIVLERQLALAIVHEVGGRLEPAQEMRLTRTRPMNLSAYDAYLRGRYLFGERTPEAETAARQYFEQAVHADPESALPYTGLADCYSTSWDLKTDYLVAEKYARKAVSLAPDLAEAHASLGLAEAYQYKFAEASKELERAIELNPNYAMAHHWHSLEYVFMGRTTEALAANDRARQPDPYSFPINYLRGVILCDLHEYGAAVEQMKLAASISSNAPAPHIELQRIYWIEGRVPEALTEERTLAALAHNSEAVRDLERVAAAYRNAGLKGARTKDVEIKQKWYARQQHAKTDTSSGLYWADEIAFCYALTGEKQKSLLWLDRSVEERPDTFPLDVWAPAYGWLRSDPEFRALLRRAGLTQ